MCKDIKIPRRSLHLRRTVVLLAYFSGVNINNRGRGRGKQLPIHSLNEIHNTTCKANKSPSFSRPKEKGLDPVRNAKD